MTLAESAHSGQIKPNITIKLCEQRRNEMHRLHTPALIRLSLFGSLWSSEEASCSRNDSEAKVINRSLIESVKAVQAPKGYM